MDVSWLLWLLSAALLVSLVVMTMVCLDCRRKRPLASISQTLASEDYMPSTEFGLIHPAQRSIDLSSIRSPSHHLSPPRLISSPGGTQRRHNSFSPTENESIPSYENQAEGPEYVNPDPGLSDSDVEDPGYLIVIPGREALTPSNQSRASTPSSDVRHEYVNLKEEEEKEKEEEGTEDEDDEDQNYQNVNPQLSQEAASPDDTESDDDDDEGNYVNQPLTLPHPQINTDV